MDWTVTIPILFGWFLGLLSYPIQRYLNRKSQRKDMISGLTAELDEFRYSMALVACGLKTRHGTFDTEFAKWYSDIVVAYEGIDANPRMKEFAQKLVKSSEDELSEYRKKVNKQGVTPISPEYGLPYLSNIVSDLGWLNPIEKRKVLILLQQIDILNTKIRRMQKYFWMTFDESLSPENRQVINSSELLLISDIGNRARSIAERITDIVGVRGMK